MTPPITAWAGTPSAEQRGRHAQRAASGLPGGDEGGDRDGGEHEGEHPVAELDRLVHVERAVRRKRLVGAARPGGAAEAGAGEPHRAAGDDDADVGHQARPGRAAARSRVERPGILTPT